MPCFAREGSCRGEGLDISGQVALHRMLLRAQSCQTHAVELVQWLHDSQRPERPGAGVATTIAGAEVVEPSGIVEVAPAIPGKERIGGVGVPRLETEPAIRRAEVIAVIVAEARWTHEK